MLFPARLSLPLLVAVKRRTLRRGAWFRVPAVKRALIDAAIAYLRRGGRAGPRLFSALREAVEEVLRRALTLRELARRIGRALAGGREVEDEVAVALGLQWMNTPRRYRRRIAGA